MLPVRNFCVIAHIDHGKSTLCDRFLEITGAVEKRNMRSQLLDSNPIERERGITIKLAPVRMKYNGHVLNLIDTPGHVDFSYEVSRSLAACEGAILVVDATQGVQAQTIGNTQKAKAEGLTIIPVVNKIDLPGAAVDETIRELQEIFGFAREEIFLISAKTGENCEILLRAVVDRIPAPKGRADKPLRALIFNSQYDSFKGVVLAVKVIDGQIDSGDFIKGQTLKFAATGAICQPLEIGFFQPQLQKSGRIGNGEVGYVATGLKNLELCQIGDTIYIEEGIKPLPGYSQPKPMVFAGIFPLDNEDFLGLKTALKKLKLTDSALFLKPIVSQALGSGFYAGFLGLLHCDIVKERLWREFNQSVILTNPSVEYRVVTWDKPGQEEEIANPSDFPPPEKIREIKEPMVEMAIFSPTAYLGELIKLCEEKRGRMINLEYLEKTVKLTYFLPLAEIITDFYDRLKSASSGFASVSYEFNGYQSADIEKIDILLNGQKIDALSFAAEKKAAGHIARGLVEKLSLLLPRHQFQIPVQAAVGGKVIARADVKPFRKDVIQKLYGGDRSRKDKLLEAQKKGKKKMKNVGKVTVPQNAFFEIFKR